MQGYQISIHDSREQHYVCVPARLASRSNRAVCTSKPPSTHSIVTRIWYIDVVVTPRIVAAVGSRKIARAFLLPPFNHDDVISFARLDLSNLRCTGRARFEFIRDLFKVEHEAAANLPAQ